MIMAYSAKISALCFTLFFAACQPGGADEQSLGMSLHFLNHGKNGLGIRKFDPDGVRGPVPGSLGPSLTGGAHMAFMAGDRKRGLPKFVDITWIIATPEIRDLDRQNDARNKIHSKEWEAEYARIEALIPKQTARVELKGVVTLDMIDYVRAHPKNSPGNPRHVVRPRT